MKKIISLVITIVMMVTVGLNAAAGQNGIPVTVFVDGEQILFDVDPVIEDGRTLVPMRYIFEALGAGVDWIAETSTAVAVKDDIKIEITVGKNELIKNGSAISLDVPAKIIDGRMLVPARAVSEGMEAKVDWDGELRKVIITSKNGHTDAEKTENSTIELSSDDAQIIKDMAEDFRYVFEQQLLPDEILPVASELVPLVDLQSKELSDAIYEIWDQNLAIATMNLQLNSEDASVFEDKENATDEEIITDYIKLLKKMGLDSTSNFEASYEDTPAGKTVLLLTFANTEFDDPMLIVSKYIAVVPDDEGCRYFTGELSPLAPELLGYDMWIFCEITTSGRGNYGALEATTKEAFMNKIDYIIDNNCDLRIVAN